MAKRNPVLSMSGNMWAQLLKLRTAGKMYAKEAHRTLESLVLRGFVECRPGGSQRGGLPDLYAITDLGRMVADAYHEGQESKA